MKKLNTLAVALAALTLVGCKSGDESVAPSPTPGTAEQGFVVSYVPLGGVAPLPNDLFFNGSEDGTLNLPVADPDDTGDPLVAMNALDGWSVNAPIYARFTDVIDPDTLAANVFVLEVDIDPNTTATVGFRGLLTPGVDYDIGVADSVDTAGTMMEITPLRPLASGQTLGGLNIGYLVFITNSVESSVGAAAEADNDYADMVAVATGASPSTGNPTLDQLSQLIGAHLQLGDAVLSLDPADIAVSFSFTTQDPNTTMETVAGNATSAGQTTVVSAGVNNQEVLDPGMTLGVVGLSDIYVGVVSVPYYHDAANPLSGNWEGVGASNLTRYNPEPVVQSTEVIPLMVTVPTPAATAGFCPGGVMPAGGYPTVVFQHGITQDRTNVIALGDALGQACLAAVAIDHPLHGITDDSGANPFYMDGFERTFNLDVVNNTTGAAGPDGVIDDSGTHYINLQSLLTSRDNLRQSAADILRLVATVPDLDLDGSALTQEFQLAGFVGHSLGGITGATALGSDGAGYDASLAMPGGNISELLQNSPTIGAQVNAGLAASGVNSGTRIYDEFFRNAQTVIDAGDPVNYAAQAATDHNIHMIKVLGDTVVPNVATDNLIDEMGLSKVVFPGAPVTSGYVEFVAGDHGSILDPSASLDATVEMQTQVATFMAAGVFFITDGTVTENNP